jgi:hypothetical protein
VLPIPARKECCTESPRRIWADRPGWVSPLGLWALDCALWSNHSSTQVWGRKYPSWIGLEDALLESAAELVAWLLVGRNLHTFGDSINNLCWTYNRRNRGFFLYIFIPTDMDFPESNNYISQFFKINVCVSTHTHTHTHTLTIGSACLESLTNTPSLLLSRTSDLHGNVSCVCAVADRWSLSAWLSK